MANLKYSRQREAIKDYLSSVTTHPTADTVYMHIKEEFPNISLGTVYRNLSLLSDRGDILRLSCDGKTDRFDADTRPHYHFMCKQCGCVLDIDMPYQEALDHLAEQTFSGTITAHSLLFEGLCSDCMDS